MTPIRARTASGDGDDVVPADAGDAGVGAQQRGEDVDRRGLAGAVRSEQGEHAGGGDVEVERVEHELVTEGLGQPFELDGGGHEVTEVSERWTLIEA